ncbi:ribonuclease H-like domain-containing protein [Cladochytrium replicatum]|nr:ribonuclease H-like domain-containing protein [Cladochytrium replicatum]
MLASESVTPLVCVFAQGFRIKLDSPEHVDMACDLLYRLVNIGAAADIVSLLEQFPNLNDKIDFGRIALGTLRTYDMNAVSSYLSKSPKRQKRFFAVVEDDVKEKLFQLEDSLDNASWISSEQSFELKMHSKHISKLIMKWKWGFSDYPSIDLGTKISSALWLIRGLCISAVNRPSGDGSDFNDDRVGLLARDFVESRCGLIEMLLDDITSSSGKTLLGKIIMFVLLSHIETRSTSTYFVQKLAAKGVDNADWTARLETIIIPREFSSSAIFTSDDSAEEGIAEGNNNALQKKKQSNSAHLRKEDTEVQKTLREAISHYPIYALTDPVTLIDNPSQLEYTKIKAIFESSEQAIVGMDCEWVPDILARHANIMAGPTAEDDHTQEKVDETASTTENGSLDDLAHGKKRKRKGNVDHPRSTPPAIMQLGVSTGDSKHIYILDLLSLSALEVQALLVPLLTNKSMLKLAFDFSNDLVKLRSVYESIPPNVENLIDLSKKINHQQTPRTTSEFVAPKLFAHGSRISLAQVVVHYLKMRMDKSVRLSDWSKRPLANAQVRYGATDVAVLLDAYEVMRKSKESQDC